MKRYSVSGIFIFDKFPDEERRQPTCVEDCQQETRLNWLKSLDIEALKRVFNILKEKIQEIINIAFEGTGVSVDIDELLAEATAKVASYENREIVIKAVDLIATQLHDVIESLVTDGILTRVEEDDEICGDSSDIQ